jgi:pyruvate formate lyase activating enzyme
MALMVAKLYTPVASGVRCDLCARRCIIPEGKVGFCNVRRNVGGRLLTDIYGYLTLRFIDNIEKKPLYHFNPGSSTFSFGTTSCNFRCKFCINYELSTKNEFESLERSFPSEIVEIAIKSNCQGVSFTYNEPTIFFEYAYDTAKLAHKEGLYATMLTNGYMTPEAVNMIAPYLDAVTVDIKGAGNAQFYKKLCDVSNVHPIYECIKAFRDNNVHIEITDLVTLENGDSVEEIKKLGRWVLDNLGPETPMHLLPFRQECLMDNKPVCNTVDISRNLRELGLKYIYNKYEKSTKCTDCGEELITRTFSGCMDWDVSYNLTAEYSCPRCGTKVPITGTCFSGRRIESPASAIESSDGYWGYEG